MIFYLAATRDRYTMAAVKERVDLLGMLCFRGYLNRCPEHRGRMDWIWGYDNGAFADAKSGLSFDVVQFWNDVRRMLVEEWHPTLCVLPDVPFHGGASFLESCLWARSLPRSLPWYLAVQDGMSPELVERALVEWDLYGIFVGGSTEFKSTLPTWVRLAHRHGRRCHFGRASNVERIVWANDVGADSADSTAFQFTRDKLRRLLDIADRDFVPDQGRLFGRWEG